ncbi:hypothetical protein [Bacteroides sp.]|uniref:hypothetical protein n=1 Tax=Bacteroides sp. TaxID=29523 RepID=UPI002618FFB8|nr:hypothetical protein [Bacteroides sp.]
MKIQFRTGRYLNQIYFLPFIKIYRSRDYTSWKRFSIEIGFLCWAIGWFFAFVPYCDRCGVYFKEECTCDDDLLDLDDDEYED